MSTPEANPNEAGTYIIENGVRRLLEAATVDHPEGNRARPAEDEAAADPLPGPDGGKSVAAKALKNFLKGGDK